MKDNKIPSLYLIPTLIIGALMLLVVIMALFVSLGYRGLANKQMSRAANPYEDYGINVPDDFTCVFSYESTSDGFHGDRCEAVKYKTNGNTELFSDFNDSSDLQAESKLNFALSEANVPLNLYPNYNDGYYWKLFSSDDGKELIILWFHENNTAFFGEIVT